MIQDYNNFYAAFKGVTKAVIKNIFIENNWGCRKESWYDFHLVNAWSALVLHGDESEPLISGAVLYNNTNTENLDRVFNLLPGSFVYGFYDPEHLLLFEKKKGLP